MLAQMGFQVYSEQGSVTSSKNAIHPMHSITTTKMRGIACVSCVSCVRVIQKARFPTIELVS